MEDSKAQRKVIELGKAIVKELELDPGVDTLSKWMAHYLAEKIELIKTFTGKEKSDAETECFDIILRLWEHRWSAPPFKRLLEDFVPLLETLETLNPNKENPFFYPARLQFSIKEENNMRGSKRTKSYLDAAMSVDKLARLLIYDLLYQSVNGLDLLGERGEYIRNAIDLTDYPDTRIIQFTTDYNDYVEIKENDGDYEKNQRIKELKQRIDDLEEFNIIKESLLKTYKKKLSEIDCI